MGLTLRLTKGSELTYQEMDDNIRTFLTTYEAKTESFTAAHGRLYLVTPDEDATVVATLPDPGEGRMAFRLEDTDDDRLLSVDPGTEAIEGETAEDTMTIDFAGQVVVLTWDGAVWRVS